MAKIGKCGACGEKVATDAKACPHCGHKQPKGFSLLRVLGLMAFLFFGVAGFLFPVLWLVCLVGLLVALFA